MEDGFETNNDTHTNIEFETFSYIRKERVVNHTMYKNFFHKIR